MTEAVNTEIPATAPARSREYVGFSPGRIWIIAVNTFTESIRQKVYNVLLIFALIAIASASFFAQFSFSEQLKFVKDFCLGSISVFGTLIAIVGTAQLLPNEVENRTIYTILSKPVRRFEFLLGKYMGSILLVVVSVVMMSLMFGLALKFKENRLIAELRSSENVPATKDEREAIAQIRAEAFDPDIVKGVILIVVKLSLLAAITLFFSTFSTSMVFNVIVSFMAFFVGHLRAGAVDVWASHKILMAILAIVPDLGAFNVADDIILGNVIPWWHVAQVAFYGVARTLVIVVAAHLIFSKREI